MLTGTVKWFNARKGYGFITSENGEDVFVHYSGIIGEGFRSLEENGKVSYDLADGKDGKKIAVNVKPVEAA